MNDNEKTQTSQQTIEKSGCGCGGGGCSATDGGGHVEKVESYQEASSRKAYVPAVDIVDAKDLTTLTMDLPGVDMKDVDISVEKNILTVKARQGESSFGDKQLVYSEYGVGDYHRSFVLSDEVQKDGITASLKDGVLSVKLPKASPVSKKIAVGS